MNNVHKKQLFLQVIMKLLPKTGRRDWNKSLMPHKGRHPNAYHEWVLRNMESIKSTPGINQQKFINDFNIRVRQPVLENPLMLRKSY